MKYIFTVLLTFVLTMGLYHLFVRPFAVTRFLFGMKPLPPRQGRKELRESASPNDPVTAGSFGEAVGSALQKL
jgi:hypothetical protein